MLVRVGPLPVRALEATAAFYADWMPRIETELARGGAVLLVFPPSGHEHRGWRLAAVQGLAREHAPARINGVASDDEAAIAAAAAYLERAPGVTGQYWAIDGSGAGNPLG